MSQPPSTTGKPMKKVLGLWDVYAISTGAMFSSGFFLLPGIATAKAGPSTVLAYLVAGILMIPAMLSMAELATALPRAGGTYFFLDRSLGPGAGTVGGLGTWLALVLKSAFALIGMGAYLAITPFIGDFLPGGEAQREWVIKGLAVALTVVFALVNIFGAKETTKLQGILVISLLGILAFFVVQGLAHVFGQMEPSAIKEQYTPFFIREKGLDGFIATIGLVFVSYAGLTKVASVSEEVKRPDRNLPLGMILSLATATAIYVIGVFIMISVLDPNELRSDQTPVATAAESFFHWLPPNWGLILIIVAALAAFASTGNAGILAASRYPLAMARDNLISPKFAILGKFGTPTLGIIATAGLMIAFIVLLSAEGVAKIASAFNLFVFGLMNISVIVMREAKIDSYDPGFRSPLYPWMQLAGVLIAGILIVEMGFVAIAASLILAGLSAGWYVYYARGKVVRNGAIYHIFERLGRSRFEGIDTEFRQIIKEKGLRADDPFDDLVAQAGFVDLPEESTYDSAVGSVALELSKRTGLTLEVVQDQIRECALHGNAPISRGAMIPHFRIEGLEKPEMVLVRCCEGLSVERPMPTARRMSDAVADVEAENDTEPLQRVTVKAIFFLVSPEDSPGLHLRVLAQIATRVESDGFMDEWCSADHEQSVKETLLHDRRFVVLQLVPDTPTGSLIGKTLADLELPTNTLVAMIRRKSTTFIPQGRTTLQADDRITLIGQPDGIAEAYKKYLNQSPPETDDEE